MEKRGGTEFSLVLGERKSREKGTHEPLVCAVSRRPMAEYEGHTRKGAGGFLVRGRGGRRPLRVHWWKEGRGSESGFRERKVCKGDAAETEDKPPGITFHGE